MKRPLDGWTGRTEAARLLGVTVRTLALWTRQGLLTPRFIGDKREMHYALSDLQMLRLARSDKNTDVWHVKALALQALSTAKSTELRLLEVFDHLGLNGVALDRGEEGIRAICNELTNGWTIAQLLDPSWVRYWGGVFFATDEVYFALVHSALGDDEPWKRFMDFANDVTRGALVEVEESTRASDELRVAYKYFQAGARHLWYVGYMHCRRRHGRRVADVVFDGSHSAVDELIAILH